MDPVVLKSLLGKNGLMLHNFANGLDDSPVAVYGDVPPQKSIGNSTTSPRDLVSEEDDGFYEVECPSCGETVYFDDTLDTDSLVCPSCGEKVMDFETCSEECDGDCDACASKE